MAEAESEALRLKAMAESKFKGSNNNAKSALKYAKRAHRLCPHLTGVSETVAALSVLAAPDPAAASSGGSTRSSPYSSTPTRTPTWPLRRPSSSSTKP
ncbi:hypothetical protein glysoja_029518 [Glycine soja]|uniref:Uncharacterized protein n=1 Tax=Glycine soja TaxID=3848 RepID=A0A0B2QGY6_GLYSO|nr:hypothetical protein glysoja_029518 [Glycine soja]